MQFFLWSPVMAADYVTSTGIIRTDAHSFVVDGNLDVSEGFCFRTLSEALENVSQGTDVLPMKIYIAPGVYWMDNADDPEVRRPEGRQSTPFAVTVNCDNLHLMGLGSDPKDVVIAVNRGQTQGAIGNYTMFQINGSGFEASNITFGNFCNVDLDYPKNPSLSRKKRAGAIVQAQIGICNGDRYYFRNCRFISRLNLCPFVGGKRTLYENCYFESTDDALNGECVYLNCDFTLFSSKPVYGTSNGGAVFLDCNFNSKVSGTQYITKTSGQAVLVDCNFTGECTGVEWTPYPQASLRCYQAGVILNGQEYVVAEEVGQTVEMEGLDILDAYRFEYDGETVYNVYNLLSGNDGWDPLGQKTLVERASQSIGRALVRVPVYLQMTPSVASMTTGDGSTRFTVKARLHDGTVAGTDFLGWTTVSDNAHVDEVIDGACMVSSVISTDYPEKTELIAMTGSGLEAASAVTVIPSRLEAPLLVNKPVLSNEGKEWRLDYLMQLDGHDDVSRIDWFRCIDADGKGAIMVSAANDAPFNQTYLATKGDAGSYLKAVLWPQSIRSDAGEPVEIISKAPVSGRSDRGKDRRLRTDFSHFPTVNQPFLLPGTWTVDGYKPEDTSEFNWRTSTDNWYYGTATDGAVGQGLVQKSRGARIMYTPVPHKYKNMRVSLAVDPCKSAGQGFGSATGQYMDVFIKMDTYTMTGYALRVERTPEHDKAVEFVLIRYDNGQVTRLTEPAVSETFKTGCRIDLQIKGGKFTATSADVSLECQVEKNEHGGTGVLLTGTAGSNAIMLHSLEVEWK